MKKVFFVFVLMVFSFVSYCQLLETLSETIERKGVPYEIKRYDYGLVATWVEKSGSITYMTSAFYETGQQCRFLIITYPSKYISSIIDNLNSYMKRINNNTWIFNGLYNKVKVEIDYSDDYEYVFVKHLVIE